METVQKRRLKVGGKPERTATYNPLDPVVQELAAAEEAEHRRNMRIGLAVAAVVHIVLLVVTIPDPDMNRLDFYNFLANELNMGRQFNSKGEFLIYFKNFLLQAYRSMVRARKIDEKIIVLYKQNKCHFQIGVAGPEAGHVAARGG